MACPARQLVYLPEGRLGLLDPSLHRLLVLAGDKLGSWYAGTFDLRAGSPADLPWHELPELDAAFRRDDIYSDDGR